MREKKKEKGRNYITLGTKQIKRRKEKKMRMKREFQWISYGGRLKFDIPPPYPRNKMLSPAKLFGEGGGGRN